MKQGTSELEQHTRRFSGFVIVHLAEGIAPDGEGVTLLDFAKSHDLGSLVDILTRHELFASQRSIQSVPVKEIVEWEAKAMKTHLPPLRSLATYWQIDVRGRYDEAVDAIVAELAKIDQIVDQVYRESLMTEPVVHAGNEQFTLASQSPFSQKYLLPKPDGINALWAWSQLDGAGEGVRFVDLEKAWIVDHEDIAGLNLNLIYGANRRNDDPAEGHHGAAVLGIVAATDNTRGVIGIAAHVAFAGITSRYQAPQPDRPEEDNHVADAILSAVATSNPHRLQPGDVLLLEVQVDDALPAEAEYSAPQPLNFHAIRLVSSMGVIVIEPAGNGDNDLDQLSFFGLGDSVRRNPPSPQFQDSGAIMVGAGDSITQNQQHARWLNINQGIALGGSNYGSRIDCYAWGNNITTLGFGDLQNPLLPQANDDRRAYTKAFDGTSGAAAIIAGTVAVVQGLFFSATGSRFTPDRIRQVVCDPHNGTPQLQSQAVTEPIGVMPDIHECARSLGIA